MQVDLLFLSNKAMQAAGVTDMEAAIEDVKNAYLLNKSGDVINPGKCVLRWGETVEDENTLGRINAMPGYIGGKYDMAGIKWIGSGPQNYKKGLPRASVTVVLNDPDTKLPVGIVDGTEISSMRTGASGGIAIDLLAKKQAEVMTICGAGAQGHTQLQAALLVRPGLHTVYVYDIRRENAERFAQINARKYPAVTFIVTDDVEEAVRQSDIIDCVTLAAEPIIKGGWLKKGALVMNMADYEADHDCVFRADKVVVDFWENVKHRMISTVALMWRDGLFRDEQLHGELGDILAGAKAPRESEDEIIYFNAVGAGILDLAVAARCYKKAKEDGIGISVPYWE